MAALLSLWGRRAASVPHTKHKGRTPAADGHSSFFRHQTMVASLLNQPELDIVALGRGCAGAPLRQPCDRHTAGLLPRYISPLSLFLFLLDHNRPLIVSP